MAKKEFNLVCLSKSVSAPLLNWNFSETNSVEWIVTSEILSNKFLFALALTFNKCDGKEGVQLSLPFQIGKCTFAELELQ